jgi:hypothetical protein
VAVFSSEVNLSDWLPTRPDLEFRILIDQANVSVHQGLGFRIKFLAWQVVGDVLALNAMALNMKRRRFEDGALRLDTVKLAFSLDDDGNPAVCHIHGTLTPSFPLHVLPPCRPFPSYPSLVSPSSSYPIHGIPVQITPF